MKVGIVCPYSLDVPGGVQSHVKDLAGELIARGHRVSVLAPAAAWSDVPDFVVRAGRAVAVPYNGSVARVRFGPVAAVRVRRWVDQGDFDVLHLHDPGSPSLSLLALGRGRGHRAPVVATVHTSDSPSRMHAATAGVLRPRMKRIAAHIAVSPYTRGTVLTWRDHDPLVIPNGVSVGRFREARAEPGWAGPGGTLCFVGRIDEPRKGLGVLLEAFALMAAGRPGLRLLVVGGGDLVRAGRQVPSAVRRQVRFLGRLDDPARARALRTADVFVAPNTGGESFGLVLIEAMAAGAAVVASDLPAFSRVLDQGRLGVLFARGDAAALSSAVCGQLDRPRHRRALVEAASEAVRRYDWSRVAGEIERVYENVLLTP